MFDSEIDPWLQPSILAPGTIAASHSMVLFVLGSL